MTAPTSSLGGFAGLGAVPLIADLGANTARVRGSERADWRRFYAWRSS